MHIEWKSWLTLALLGALAVACGDGDDSTSRRGGGSGGGGGGAGGNAADPWECPEENVARRKEDGAVVQCGMNRCKTDAGCPYNCASDEDCVDEYEGQEVHCGGPPWACGPDFPDLPPEK